jgi:hypothetical protein
MLGLLGFVATLPNTNLLRANIVLEGCRSISDTKIKDLNRKSEQYEIKYFVEGVVMGRLEDHNIGVKSYT